MMSTPSLPDPRPLVLHVIPTLSLGGAASGVAELARATNAGSRYRAVICVLGGESAQDPDVPATTVFLDSPVQARRLAGRRCARLRRLAQELEPAIVHLHLWPTVPTAAVSLVGLRVRIIVHVRDTPPVFRQRNARALVNRWLYGVSLRALRAHCVSVSRAAADHTARGLKVPLERLRVVLNGIDLRKFPERPRPRTPAGLGNPFVVGSGGRFSPEKGHLDLIRAVAAIRRSGLNIRLRIAGDGSMRGAYAEQAKVLGLGDGLELPGAVQDMGEFYRSLDLFVLPSLREGLSRMLLEAMASGIPCVATDAEGVSEVLTSGVDGLLVSRGDVPALQAAVERLYHEPALRDGLGTRGRRRVEAAFSLERVGLEVLGLYDELLARTS